MCRILSRGPLAETHVPSPGRPERHVSGCCRPDRSRREPPRFFHKKIGRSGGQANIWGCALSPPSLIASLRAEGAADPKFLASRSPDLLVKKSRAAVAPKSHRFVARRRRGG